MLQLSIENIYIQNLLIFLYVIIIYYFIFWNKNLRISDIFAIIGLTLIVVIPYTIYIQYNLYFNVVSDYDHGAIFLAPLEELTKLIPVIYIITGKKLKNRSISDFAYAGIVSGASFYLFENLLYNRGEEQLNFFCGALNSLGYLDMEVNFSHIVTTGLIALCIGLTIKVRGSLLKKLSFIILTLFTLSYFTFEHGFYNAAIVESLFGIIDYPDNETAVFIHDLLGKNKYSHIILFIASIVIAIVEAVTKYKLNKQISEQKGALS